MSIDIVYICKYILKYFKNSFLIFILIRGHAINRN